MIYVDQFPGSGWGMWNGGGHMLGSSLADLHSHALLIDLRISWFQDKHFPHYDLTRNKRLLAIEWGATPIEFGEFPPDILVKMRDGSYRAYDNWVTERNLRETSARFLLP